MTTTFRRPCDKQEIKSGVDLNKRKKNSAMEREKKNWGRRAILFFYTWLDWSPGVSTLIPVFHAMSPCPRHLLQFPLTASHSCFSIPSVYFLLLFTLTSEGGQHMHREMRIISQLIFCYDNFINNATLQLLCGLSVHLVCKWGVF